MTNVRISYAQNGEDVRVWRAFRDLDSGYYVEVGASDPVADSTTAALSEAGWRGLLVEADESLAQRLRAARPHDLVVHAAARAHSGLVEFDVGAARGLGSVVDAPSDGSQRVPAMRVGDLLTDLGPSAVHFMSVDVEGGELEALQGADLDRWQPWVLSVESTQPNSRAPSHEAWEPLVLAAGYTLAAHDGLNRWYVALGHEELAPAIAEPLNALDENLDGWLRWKELVVRQRVELLERSLEQQTAGLREQTTLRQAQEAAEQVARRRAAQRLSRLERQLDAEQQSHLETQVKLEYALGRERVLLESKSWRLTRPLRQARAVALPPVAALPPAARITATSTSANSLVLPGADDHAVAAGLRAAAPSGTLVPVPNRSQDVPGPLGDVWADVLGDLRTAVSALPDLQAIALLDRALTAHGLFELHGCTRACQDDALGVLVHLVERHWSSGSDLALSALWLGTAARLPSAADHENTVWQVEAGRPGAGTPLVKAVEALLHEPAVHRLHVLPTSTLLVEVTHTYAHTWLLTGIQRVVRGLVGALDAEQSILVRVDGPGRLALVEHRDWHDALARGALDAERTQDGPPVGAAVRHRAIQGLLAVRAPLAGRIRRNPRFAQGLIVRVGRRTVRRLIAQQGSASSVPPPTTVAVVACRSARLLLPELTATDEGVETMLRWQARLDARLNMVFYDAIPLTHPQYCLDSLVSGLARYGRLLRQASHVMPISNAVAVSAAALVNLEGRSEVSVTAVPLPGAAVVGETVHDAGLPRDPRLLLCVSSLEPRKNHVRLLRAARRLHDEGHDFRLVLVGGSGWMSERIDEEIAQARAEGVEVEVERGLPDAALAELYDRARAVVFVSEVEGYGLPIVEALAHGTPVVCSDLGSMAEVAEGGGCLLVNPYDISSIADGVERVLTDNALHAQLHEQALGRSQGSWQAYADGLLALVGPPVSSLQEARSWT